jgi:glycosyltransferase involved in cell wall biosynthesis
MDKNSSIILDGRKTVMPLNLLILTSYFAMEPKNIAGGIGYRYVGLYGSLIKALFKRSPESKVFWYSQNDWSLRIIDQGECKRLKKTMLGAIMNVISDAFKNKSYLAVIIAYPYAVPRIKRIFEYIFCLLILKIVSVGRVKVIVDDFDPPVEATYAFSETKPSIATITYCRILEMLTLNLASSIITLSEFWTKHFARIYHIRQEKFFIVSNGSLVKYIRYNPTKTKDPFIVLYAGSAMKVKDVDKLVTTVAKLREKGLHIDLYIAGAKELDLPQ